ncbi:Pre-rRNA-processing protein TSR1 [Echinococcus granulosus]|uniref:Pre-rRNA-processing protein TSR1 homolog n=1 Tax=Echinococcus granulosus TaxID=6210 RepID=W6UPY6_ECHGR|nr:Pre-rRNA-processing protein TSR1 [Echinococcus granulosus]EUB62851.1 Pre-rRNA-processing protein TSR1 [Echinococcus granulosus]
MGLQRHVSGSLKQTNKRHKGGRKRSVSINSNSGLGVSKRALSRRSRKLLAKQQRLHKTKVILAAQKQTEVPITCFLLPLSSSIDLSLAKVMLAKGDPKAIKHGIFDIDSLKYSHKADYLYASTIKKPFCFVSGNYGDLFGCLDLARIADWIIFFLPGDMSKIDPDFYSELMSALYSQGLPPSVFVVMSNISDRKELLSMIQTKFSVSDGKVRALNSTGDAQSLLRFLSQSQKKPTLSTANSYLVTKNALTAGTAATRLRSGMLVEAISVMPHEENEGEVYLRLEGLLRGWDLPLFDLVTFFADQRRAGCPHMHITGWGDFPLRSATWTEYKPNRKLHQPPPRSFNWRATSGPDEYLADALSTAWNNLQLSDDEDYAELGESDKDEDRMVVDDVEGDEEAKVEYTPSDSDNESIYFDAIDGEAASSKVVSFNTESIVTAIPASKPKTVAEKIKAAKTELQFPDEVETPFDVPARERFTKYRGLPSFSKCTWPTNNDTTLPYEYGKIFRFENYTHNRRTLIKHTLRLLRQLASETTSEPTFIPSGSITSLTLGPVPQTLGAAVIELHTDRNQSRPLTVWSLLPYERCMSVLHLTMHKRQPEFESATDEDAKGDKFDPDPIMAKEPMLFQVGIRRFTASPIYSQTNKAANTNSKMEHFFTLSSSPIVATMYAPVVYAPQTVLQFRIEPAKDIPKMAVSRLVATGSVLSVDPTRAIVKRILLSGHPYKINKRSAVVRYMFHTPEDPIQLYTKSGAVGHIKQSVGTHGLMKCLFDHQLSASDVVLMPLYKRVFPKMNFDPQVTLKVAEINPAGRSEAIQKTQPVASILKSGRHQQEAEFMRSVKLTPDEEALFA